MTERSPAPPPIPLSRLVIVLKGAGEMASAVAHRLHRAGLKQIVLFETQTPLAVRRGVSFSEAVYEGRKSVEGLTAVRTAEAEACPRLWERGDLALLIDPAWKSIERLRPQVLIDAILAKRNLGTARTDAPLVIALGPGFTAGRDAHFVIETNRGHNLGRVIDQGTAEADTGIPGAIGGVTVDRLLRAPAEGIFTALCRIGDRVTTGQAVGHVGDVPVVARIDGVLRGLIRPQTAVSAGLKIGDVDPRGDIGACHSISDKARAVGGAVLETILRVYNR